MAQRLYDPARDSQAKQGADAAGKISNGDLWEKMARNLDKLSKEDISTYLLDQQVSMRSTIDNMGSWTSVDKFVEGIGRDLGPEPTDAEAQRKKVAQQRQDLEAQIKQTEAALAALRKQQSNVPDVLRPVFDNIGDIDAAVQGLRNVASSGAAGAVAARVIDAVGVLKQIQSVFATADRGLAAVNSHRADLGGLDLDVQRTVLLRLQADEEHLKNQAAIIARRAEEERDLVNIVKDYQVRRKRFSAAPDSVPDSLGRAASGGPDAAGDQAMALYDAAALAARGRTPAALERLRTAQEEERYSIRKSAAEARAYEQLLASGARRLALFYAGGTKPETVAQLLFNALSLANLGYLTYAK